MKNLYETHHTKRPSAFLTLLAAAITAAAACLTLAPTASASSHSDAPLIKLDPQANLTDVYAFISEKNSGQKVLVVEVSVRPFSEPGDGVSYDAFSSDALYSIHIANPTTGEEVQRYDFKFSPVDVLGGSYKNTATILRYGLGTELGPIITVGDARQNFVQTYDVYSVIDGKRKHLNDSPLLVPPPNVGSDTTPSYNGPDGRAISGATNRATLDPYTAQTVYDLPCGATVFAGPREDGFYCDIPGIFDLLDGRILNTDGNGVDGFKGFNVLHYAIVIPLKKLPSFPYTGLLQPPSTGVGVYASVSRPRVTLRSSTGGNTDSGPYIQVDREANPFFNEGLVALADKDNYNRTLPTDDATSFAKYALNSELAVLINTVFGTTFQTDNRTDLQTLFIPDLIRVDTTTGPVPVAGEPAFNRLSFIGGDTVANGDGVQIPSGWPNGRRFGDDVADIALTAIASGPSYATINLLGDNVNANDQLYNQTFPYAGTPNSGTRNSKDSGENDTCPPAGKARVR